MHPIDIQNCLDQMTLLLDSREQRTDALKKRLGAIGLPHERVALTSGDYSVKTLLPDGREFSLADKVVIERKMSLNEISQNFTKGRDRFSREFDRFVGAGGKIYLLIEGGSYEKIMQHKYRTQFAPEAFLASLFAWQARYNAEVIFCESSTSGYLIRKILHYEMRERLERGEADDPG